MHGRLRGGLKLLPEQLIGRHLEVCIYRRNYPADNSAQISFPPLRYLSSKQASKSSLACAEKAFPWCCTWENKARRRQNSFWADAQPLGTTVLLEGAPTPLTALRSGTYSCCSRSLK